MSIKENVALASYHYLEVKQENWLTLASICVLKS